METQIMKAISPVETAGAHNRWFQFFILLSAPLLTVIDAFIVNIAIPSIEQGIHAGHAEIQLIIASYMLGYASFQITGGRAGDHFGRKKVFFWSMLFFTVSSCLCGLSLTPWQLIIARFLQGLTGAFMMPQTLSYLQVLFPEPGERTKAIGYLGITLGGAALIGQIAGGFLSGLHFIVDGWRLIFFINLPVGALALWATKTWLKETKINRAGAFDYYGVILLTLALSGLIYPLAAGREKHWPLWSLIMILLSFALFVGFFLDQKRKSETGGNPLMNISLFRIRDFNIGLLLVAFYFMMHASYLLIATEYMQNGMGFSPVRTGLLFVWMGIFFTLSSYFSISLVKRFGKQVLQTGAVIIIVAHLAQIFFMNRFLPAPAMDLLMAIYGLGAGLVLPSLINMALKSVPVQLAGTASGIYNTFQQAFSSLGICLVAGLFYYFLPAGGGNNYPRAFQYSMLAEIGCVIIVLGLLFVLPDAVKSKQKSFRKKGKSLLPG
jgi:EmrB/QacA subfamily drug resistance transporter